MKDYVTIVGDRIGWPKAPEGTLAYWRERILLVGYVIGVAVCGVAFAASMGHVIRETQFLTLLIEFLGFAWALTVLMSKGRFSYAVRSATVVTLVYMAAVIALYEVGPASMASADFVSFCVFAAVLFGMRGAVLSLSLTIITIGFFRLSIFFGLLPWESELMPLTRFTGWSLWLLLWSSLSSLGVAILFSGLDQALKNERALRNSLEDTVLKRTNSLREANQNLERENALRKRAEEQKQQKIEALQKALEEIKTLQGLLPICSECKKIRDDAGYWNVLESYIQKHSGVKFSHGICPECAVRLYPDLDIRRR